MMARSTKFLTSSDHNEKKTNYLKRLMTLRFLPQQIDETFEMIDTQLPQFQQFSKFFEKNFLKNLSDGEEIVITECCYDFEQQLRELVDYGTANGFMSKCIIIYDFINDS